MIRVKSLADYLFKLQEQENCTFSAKYAFSIIQLVLHKALNVKKKLYSEQFA